MSTTTVNPDAVVADRRREPLDERLFEATLGALELISVHLGRRLGLYEHLVGPCTAPQLASRAGIDIRYAREWLEQQAVAGLVRTDPLVGTWDERPYWLDDEQRAVLVEAEDAAHVSPFADMVVGVAGVSERVAEAYVTGGGVPYADYGRWFREGQAGINRPAFTHDLVDEWVHAAPDIVERLRAGGRVIDLGCGAGWSAIALARAFPYAEVIGVDSDPASIEDAVRNATTAGIDVRFEAADASELVDVGPADLVVILEALHDMSHPVDVLSAARAVLSDGGVVLVADEKVAEAFVAPGDDVERMMYGWSVSHCLPAAMADDDSAAIGTVIRPCLVESLSIEAGFASVDLSAIDAGFFNLYVLRA